MREVLIQILCAGVGTMGFALVFQLKRQHLLVAFLGGTMAWACYLIVWENGGGYFFSMLVASAVVCVWSEGQARVRMAPANVFLIPSIIPLLPGGLLYYAMSGLVSGDYDQFVQNGIATLQVAVGISSGVIIGSEIIRIVISVRRGKREERVKKGNAEGKN
ncbi:MAG: threonine/serine exporter family protein [Ruminiclostridium sp.]|nr:threonine/serine exporter family protein [Ruminiclostridium sp.]